MDSNNKKTMQVNQQFFHNFTEIVELFPQYTTAQHLAGMLRRKNPDAKEFYFLTNDELLKKIESYKYELETDLLTPIQIED